MKFLFFLILTSLTQSLFAQSQNMYWQKIELEEKVQNKIKTNLRNILEPNQYFSEVEIVYDDPGMPNFDDLKKKGTRVSDIAFDESKGDYIAFSKVGLEVPVVENFFDENQQKLKEMYRYQESFDLFKNIGEVKINIFFSDLLDEEQTNFAKNVINNLRFPVGDVKPKINFSSVKIEKKKIPEPTPAELKAEKEKKEKNDIEQKMKQDEKITQRDIMNFIARFGNALGFILATIIFGLIAFMLLKKYESIKISLSTAQKNENEVKEESKGSIDEGVAAVGTPTTAEEAAAMASSQENFARFRHFFETSLSETLILVKQWINESTDMSQMALKAVAQQFTDEELITLFKGLNDQEREKWKDYLDHFIDEKALATTNRFICEEVVRTMLDPTKMKDLSIIDLIINLSTESACKFIQENKNSGAILMNLLNPQFLGKILNHLDEAEANRVIAASMDFDFSQVTDNYESFKNELTAFMNDHKKKPFNTKVLQMLSDFNPLKESLLYNFLAKSGMQSDILQAAKHHFPYECLDLLPQEAKREIMQTYPMAKKIQFLSVCDADLKTQFINAFAEEGSSARQMLQLEFESLERNQAEVHKLESQKDTIVKEFILYIREFLKSNTQFEHEIESLLGEWVKSLNGSSKNGSGLKLAA